MKKIVKVIFILFSLLALFLSACASVEEQPTASTQLDAPSGLEELTVDEVKSLIGAPEPYNEIDLTQTEIQLPNEVTLNTATGSYSVCKLGFDSVKGSHSLGISCAGVQVDLGTLVPIIVMNFVAQGTVSAMLIPEGLIAPGTTISLIQSGSGVVLMAAVATTITAITSAAIQVAPCVPAEQYQAFLAASDPNGPKPRICTEKATLEELPLACKEHHVNHDDTPDYPDAQARWKAASDASKSDNWGSPVQDWSSQQTEPGQFRCSQTEIKLDGRWKVVRFATSISRKMTSTNAYSDITIVDVNSNQISSFGNGRWRDLIKSASDLIARYGAENVQTYPVNCYDLRQYGVTIKSSLNGDQPTRPNQAAVCTQQ